MILCIDFQRDAFRVGVIRTDATIQWYATDDRDAALGLFATVKDEYPTYSEELSAVVVLGGEEEREATWSTIRSGVAVGNTLAFTHDVPVVHVEVSGGASDEDVVNAATKATENAKPFEWIRAEYNGEPNITTPKK